MVAHFIGRIAEHEYNFFCAHGNSFQADSEAVTAEYGENDPDGVIAKFRFYIGGNLLGGGIVSLGAGNHSFRDGNHVTVPDFKRL